MTKETLAAIVTCKLCRKTFTSPKITKCLHTFCSACLDNNIDQSSIGDVKGLNCPQCQRFIAITDVTTCTNTERLLKLYENATAEKKCFQCEISRAEWRCKECDDYYCDVCKQEHDKFRKFRAHTCSRLTSTEHDSTFVLNTPVYCSDHREQPVQYYCYDCNTLFCTQCAVCKHDGHRRDLVQNALTDIKDKVLESLNAVRRVGKLASLQAEELKETRALVQKTRRLRSVQNIVR